MRADKPNVIHPPRPRAPDDTPAIHWSVAEDGADVRPYLLIEVHAGGWKRFLDLRTGRPVNTRVWKPHATARGALHAFVREQVRIIAACVRRRAMNEWTGELALGVSRDAAAAAERAIALLERGAELDRREAEAAQHARRAGESGGTA